MMTESRAELLIALSLLLQLAGIAVSVAVDPYIKKKQRRLLMLNTFLIFTLLIHNYAGYHWEMNGHMISLRILGSIYGYCARPVVLVLFFYNVDQSRNYRPFWALIAVNTLIHLTALFSDICFTITPDNMFSRGPLGYSCHFTSLVCMLYLLLLTQKTYREQRGRELLIPLANSLLVIVGVALDTFLIYVPQCASFLTIAMVSSSLFYYIWLHLQFVREHEAALMAEQRIQIMMTQIQPHFLYNTLSTIQALCRIDPEKAFDVTEKFGAYLRQNMNFLNQPDLIPLSKEMEHTKTYAGIEMLRFPSIHFQYDIEDSDFKLPALTIQPLVENAVRHGVRGMKNGTITISTRAREKEHEITIADNGKGFDTSRPIRNTGEAHIGIANVRERIEKMCGGTLEVTSSPGKGTTVRILIPIPKKR